MADSNEMQQLTQVLITRMDRQEKQQEVANDLLLRMLTQQESMFALQQNAQRNQEGFNERQEKFNERQEKFNERQDQFNIIFLDEIRGIKRDIKELTDVVLKQHETRLKRPEDFMDSVLRTAAG
ncbi:hypothetical protein [Hymenobacter coccineus]|uniref:Uncharacterized protein n=1 Tax=Hymenobacter coccineus TaxID=1908235 RepID=A0A1G1T1V5_9BACT|nr:hypothetical protein [Hymenobacter coccineus]OGX84869.1 hypothetical protein BEN49_01885 [Hymenobacter coccineus]